MPLDPLEALRKAQTIGADTGPHPEDDWLGTAVQGLLGAAGLGNDSSEANRGGQMLGAALPLMAPHPAISALLKILKGAPEVVNPDVLALGEKIGGWVPHRTAIVDPSGWSSGGTSEFPGRDPGLVDQYVLEQHRQRQMSVEEAKAQIGRATSSGDREGQMPRFLSPYGPGPSRSLVPPAPKANMDVIPRGYESIFAPVNLTPDEQVALRSQNRRSSRPQE